MLHPDQKYIEALLHNNHELIEEIYAKSYGKVKSYVIHNNGSSMEASDVFQEGLLDIYEKAKLDKVQLTCPFEAYLFMVCKNKWLNILKSARKRKETIHDPSLYNNVEAEENVDELLVFKEKMELLEKIMKLLDAKCQNLLRLSWKGMAMQEVAKKLGMTYAYVRKRKTQCIQELMELYKNSPGYKKIVNDE